MLGLASCALLFGLSLQAQEGSDNNSVQVTSIDLESCTSGLKHNLGKDTFFDTEFEPELKTYEEIHESVREWLDERQEDNDEITGPTGIMPSHKPGDVLTIGGIQIEILKHLGAGGEGYVFLVKGDRGLFSLKEFYQLNQMQVWINSTKALPGEFPRLILADNSKNLLLMEYLDGVPLPDLNSFSFFNLPEGSRENAEHQWRQISETHPYAIYDNMVFIFRTGRLRPFDPH